MELIKEPGLQVQVRHFTWIAVFLENGRVVSKSSNLDGGSFKYKRIIPSEIEMTDLTGVWATACFQGKLSCLGQRDCAVTDRDTTSTTPPPAFSA